MTATANQQAAITEVNGVLQAAMDLKDQAARGATANTARGCTVSPAEMTALHDALIPFIAKLQDISDNYSDIVVVS